MSKSFDDIVTFLDIEGNEVSNDPRWAGLQMVRQQQAAAEAEETSEVEIPDNQDYSSWNGKQLSAEIKRRNEGRDEDDQIDVSKVKKKADAAAALEADDEKE